MTEARIEEEGICPAPRALEDIAPRARHQGVHGAGLETGQGLLALALGLVAVHRHGLHALQTLRDGLR